MRVRAGKPIADQTAVCVYSNTRRAPMGELVGAVGNSSACHGSMKNDRIKFCNFHRIKTDESELEDSNAKASAGKLGLVLAGKKLILAEKES